VGQPNASPDGIDTLNAAIVDAVNGSGEIFVSHTRLNDRYAIRLAIGNLHTTETHVKRAWELFQEEAERLLTVT
jgi:aromatic-L-amino-acid decarboxylase